MGVGGAFEPILLKAENLERTAGQAGGNASSARTATARSSQERAAKRNADQQRRRREKGMQTEAGKAAELSEFDAAFQLVAEDEALGDMEQGDFYDWLQCNDLLPDEESLNDWRSSDDYECTKLERITDSCMCSGECRCTYDGTGIVPDVPGLNCDQFDEGTAHAPQSPCGADWCEPPGWMPEGWDHEAVVMASSSAKAAPPPPQSHAVRPREVEIPEPPANS